MTPHTLHQLLSAELAQRAEEGCDVAPLRAEWERLREQPADQVADQLEALWTLLASLTSPTEAAEPSTLEAIRALRPAGPRVMEHGLDDAGLHDRILGALLGRIAGCQLGKPVEGWPKAAIEAYLEACGETEIRDYLPYLANQPETLPRRLTMRACCRGELAGATRDDDQDYTLLGLILLQRKGAAVTTQDVADAWLGLLPYHNVYTAERVAYRNLVEELPPPASAWHRNPYREWIGAQIRCDGWAFASPGRPQQAAELGFRDAAVSHTKNGIYGEMLCGAMIAAAFATTDLREAIEVGLSEIPADCRLAKCVRDLLKWRDQERTWRSCWERVNAAYGHYHPVHTINNAALVLLGLLYGEGDFSATIGIAVHGGWDTDCNGATAGSVIGAMLGARALPRHWVEPLQDSMKSALFGYADNRISELADLALRLSREVRLD